MLPLLIFEHSLALRLRKLNLAKDDLNLKTQQEELYHHLPELLDVMKVPDVMEALRSAVKDSSVSPSELKAWRHAQEAMLKSTAPIRDWRSEGSSPLYDEVFFKWFSGHMKKNPSFCMKSIFIPIPWKRIVEEGPRGERDHEKKSGVKSFWGLDRAYEVLTSLDPKFSHFTVMSQSHVGQVIEVGGKRFEAVKWNNILVFDSRGMDGSQIMYPRIPIPLLRQTEKIKQNENQRQKQKQVFFAGSCHCFQAPSVCETLSRAQMGPGKAVSPGRLPNGTYDWRINECDHAIPQEQFQTFLQQSTWTIAPTGSMPVSFMMYEALQAGSLDILPWYQPRNMDKFIWLPYHDIGVQWQHGIAEIVEVAQLKSLKKIIESIPEEDIARRQKMLKHVQPLFFEEGVSAYITYMVRVANEAHRVWRDLGYEESHLGRAVDMLRRKQFS